MGAARVAPRSDRGRWSKGETTPGRGPTGQKAGRHTHSGKTRDTNTPTARRPHSDPFVARLACACSIPGSVLHHPATQPAPPTNRTTPPPPPGGSSSQQEQSRQKKEPAQAGQPATRQARSARPHAPHPPGRGAGPGWQNQLKNLESVKRATPPPSARSPTPLILAFRPECNPRPTPRSRPERPQLQTLLPAPPVQDGRRFDNTVGAAGEHRAGRPGGA